MVISKIVTSGFCPIHFVVAFFCWDIQLPSLYQEYRSDIEDCYIGVPL